MKKFGKFATFVLSAVLAFGLVMSGCSNNAEGGGGQQTGRPGTAQTSSGGNGTGTNNGGQQTGVQIPPSYYTITFNANDGSENPSTVTQTFPAGMPQCLNPIRVLGFSKQNFPFIGWSTAADATESSYGDGSFYTATANATLYALWSPVPYYSVNEGSMVNGYVTISKESAAEGDEITLTAHPVFSDYEFDTFVVTAADGTLVTVTNNSEDNTTGTFIMPGQDITVTATFKKIVYNIRIDDTMTNGTVEVGKIEELPYQTVITAKPDKGYELDEFIVTRADGIRMPVIMLGGEYTGSARFSMPSQDITVSAIFKPIIYEVEAYAMDGNGSVTISKTKAKMNEEITIAATSNTGYELDYFLITVYTDDDYREEKISAVGTNYAYTFKMPAGYVYARVIYKKAEYSVNVCSVNNGSVSASVTTARMDSTVCLTARPEKGYEFTSFSVTAADGSVIPTESTGNNEHKFKMPAQNVTVTATFTAINYMVTCGPFENGVVKADKTQATIGSAVTLTIEPATGYELSSLRVTNKYGGEVTTEGTDDTRTFTMPATDVTVTAKFRAIYSISVGAIVNGRVTVSKTSAHEGDTIKFTSTPDEGYELDSYIVTTADGRSESVAYGSFKMPAQNITVTAIFKAISYSINIGAYTNGTVMVNKTTANINEDICLTVEPIEGYELASLSVTAADGATISTSETDGKRMFKMPAQAVTVTVNFSAIYYKITIPYFANGRVRADCASATLGKTVTLIASPAAGYKLSSITLIDDDGKIFSPSIENNIRSFKMPAKNVRVKATFVEHAAASGEYTNAYYGVTFGLWPKTIISADVAVDEDVTETHGAFTYCKGDDGEWYVKQAEKADSPNLKYSDGTSVRDGGVSYKWFKVEPIKWRVLTSKSSGAKLLFAEDILTGGVPYYLDAKSRTIGGNTVYSNNYKYSTIRAWLNGKYEADDTQAATHDGKGFLQSAFTSAQQNKIETTSVDNSIDTTIDFSNLIKAKPEYVCDSTNDKIFLLSVEEITKEEYGFPGVGEWASRIRKSTDFAKATGAMRSIDEMGCGWWLRSPSKNSCGACYGLYNGNYSYELMSVNITNFGIVPALWFAPNN